LYVLASLTGPAKERWQQDRLRELHRLVQVVFADESTGAETSNLIARRRAQAMAIASDDAARARLTDAPRRYLTRHEPSAVARHVELLTPRPRRGDARVEVLDVDAPDSWWINVAARDRPHLLAVTTGAIANHGLDVVEAVIATWPDGVALDTFLVKSATRPDAALIRGDIESAFQRPLTSTPLPDAVVDFNNIASPWHTTCEVRAPDTPGLLHLIAVAFAAAGVRVIAATVVAVDGTADDRFEVLDTNGNKLDEEFQAAVRHFLAQGVTSSRSPFGRVRFAAAAEGTPV
jgi:UTP:GlnB (protein PII) uridylyltransferase